MNSIQLEDSPIVRAIIIPVIKTLRGEEILPSEKYVINADLVPRVSEELMVSKMLGEGKTSPFREIPLKNIPPIIPASPPKRILFGEPIQATKSLNKIFPKNLPPQSTRPQTQKTSHFQQSITPSLTSQNPLQSFSQHSPVSQEASNQGYRKIEYLIQDPSVTLIECSGSEKPISIVRAGQRQFTRTTLNPLEIKQILENFSNQVHIPLMEGVFRAAINNLTINAVISETIGSRFLIKKMTPYSLLDPSQM